MWNLWGISKAHSKKRFPSEVSACETNWNLINTVYAFYSWGTTQRHKTARTSRAIMHYNEYTATLVFMLIIYSFTQLNGWMWMSLMYILVENHFSVSDNAIRHWISYYSQFAILILLLICVPTSVPQLNPSCFRLISVTRSWRANHVCDLIINIIKAAKVTL